MIIMVISSRKPGRAGQDQMVLESQDGELVDLRLFCRHHNLWVLIKRREYARVWYNYEFIINDFW